MIPDKIVASTYDHMEPPPLPELAQGAMLMGPCFILNREGAYVATGVLVMSSTSGVVGVYGLWWNRYLNPPTWELTSAFSVDMRATE